jgi:hypothetical protein
MRDLETRSDARTTEDEAGEDDSHAESPRVDVNRRDLRRNRHHQERRRGAHGEPGPDCRKNQEAEFQPVTVQGGAQHARQYSRDLT